MPSKEALSPERRDVTPESFVVTGPSAIERLVKRPVRATVYPVVTSIVSRLLGLRLASGFDFAIDKWLLGQRGNDLPAHRRRLNAIHPLKGTRLLVGGCGLARELEAWLPYGPRLVLGVDYFNYAAGWRELKRYYRQRFPVTAIEFMQADLARLPMLQSNSVDVIGSDAVFEHLTDLPAVLAESYRVLRPNGVLFASFGALWFAWGGDHVSGYDGLESGYNHLLLDAPAYRRYLDAYDAARRARLDGDPAPIDPHRAWSRYGLFSYLPPGGYVRALEAAGFQREHICLMIDPTAIAFRRSFPELFRRVAERAHSAVDPLVSGMTVIYRKPGGA